MSRCVQFHLVDVFAERRLEGNALSVFVLERPEPTELLAALTAEMRQFESIFLWPNPDGGHLARVFTVEEELDFAGHPVLGAAALLHRSSGDSARRLHRIWLGTRPLDVEVEGSGGRSTAWMDQGEARLGRTLERTEVMPCLEALGLASAELDGNLPAQIVSTGLDYLVLPVRAGALDRIRTPVPALDRAVQRVGAKFIYVLDVDRIEGRTWDAAGLQEDAATGSAAGPTAAYLAAHGRLGIGAELRIAQGRFVRRPSLLRARVERSSDGRAHVKVGGSVWFTGEGALTVEAP